MLTVSGKAAAGKEVLHHEERSGLILQTLVEPAGLDRHAVGRIDALAHLGDQLGEIIGVVEHVPVEDDLARIERIDHALERGGERLDRTVDQGSDLGLAAARRFNATFVDLVAESPRAELVRALAAAGILEGRR